MMICIARAAALGLVVSKGTDAELSVLDMM